MKLLFDENLSPRLARALDDLFPDSMHVESCGLGSATDAKIWEFATQRGLVIVTRDFDFHDRSVRLGAPPKVIWLRLGNCPTARAETVTRAFAERIYDFEKEAERDYLTITIRGARF